MMPDLSGMATCRRALLAIMLSVLLLGCSSTGLTPPRPELVISGWRDPAALALTAAAQSPDDVDAVMGFAPAYRIRSNFLAR